MGYWTNCAVLLIASLSLGGFLYEYLADNIQKPTLGIVLYVLPFASFGLMFLIAIVSGPETGLAALFIGIFIFIFSLPLCLLVGKGLRD